MSNQVPDWSLFQEIILDVLNSFENNEFNPHPNFENLVTDLDDLLQLINQAEPMFPQMRMIIGPVRENLLSLRIMLIDRYLEENGYGEEIHEYLLPSNIATFANRTPPAIDNSDFTKRQRHRQPRRQNKSLAQLRMLNYEETPY